MAARDAESQQVLARSIDVESLTVRFSRRTALDSVSLEFGPGVHGLLGPNGAGKTTLIRVLATLVNPDSGGVTLLGRQTSPSRDRTEIRRRLGYLPQAFGYYPRFTVREFVEYFAWLKQMPATEVPSAVDRALAEVGLTDRAGDKLKTLSGGMLRRAGIAQAIVNAPDLLLLDEPTAGLDPEQRVDFRSLVTRLGQRSCVLISTHLVEDVASACSDVAILYEGRVAYRGTAAELTALGAARAADEGAAGSPGSPIERGYSMALAQHREQHGVAK